MEEIPVGPMGNRKTARWFHLGENSFALLYSGGSEISVSATLLRTLFDWNGEAGTVTLLCDGERAVELNISTRKSPPCWTNLAGLKKAWPGRRMELNDCLILRRDGDVVTAELHPAGSTEAQDVRAMQLEFAGGAALPSDSATKNVNAKRGGARRPGAPAPAAQEDSKEGESEEEESEEEESKEQEEEEEEEEEEPVSPQRSARKRKAVEEESEEEEQAAPASKAAAPAAAALPGWGGCPRNPYCMHPARHRGRCKVRMPDDATQDGADALVGLLNGLAEAAAGAVSPTTSPASKAPRRRAGRPRKHPLAPAGAAEEAEGEAERDPRRRVGRPPRKDAAPQRMGAAAGAAAAEGNAGYGPEADEEEELAGPSRRGPSRPPRQQTGAQAARRGMAARGAKDRGRAAEQGQVELPDPEELFGGPQAPHATLASFHLAQALSQLEAAGVVGHGAVADHDATLPYDPVYQYTRLYHLYQAGLEPEDHSPLRMWLGRLSRDKLDHTADVQHYLSQRDQDLSQEY